MTRSKGSRIMSTISRKIHTMLNTPRSIPRWFAKQPFFRYVPDRLALKILYKNVFFKDLDLNNPQTFNEKLQWLKLYDRRPEYTTMVDKYAVKKYVADRIGEEYIIPTLGVWDSFDEIDFDSLPEQFVLKCTHSSGDIVICRDKASFDKEAARKKMKYFLEKDFYLIAREWPYKNVPRRIIAEKYMEDNQTQELRDYKFFTFEGVVKALFVASDRLKKDEDTKFDFFDADYKHLDIINGHPNSKTLPKKPATFAEMKRLAEKISQGIPHVRVDFYEINGKTYFGEMTFYHWSGLKEFKPDSWDKTFGDWIKLPDITGGGGLRA